LFPGAALAGEDTSADALDVAIKQIPSSADTSLATADTPLVTADVKQILDSVMAYQLSKYTDPVFGTEWTVFGLARGGYLTDGVREQYLKDLVDTIKTGGGVLHTSKYTEYSRVILALSALGVDAQNIGGYDLTEPLAHFDKVVRQGINGPVYALIALDAGGYVIPTIKDTANQATRDRYLEYILGEEIGKGDADAGGFSLSGTTPDPDITAMTLQSLARYYGKGDAEVDGAVDRALAKLSKLQQADGGYSSWGTVNSESASQVMVALNALGIPIDDERFVKSGATVYDALMGFYLGSGADKGGFKHIAAGGVNGMATDQAAYALVSLYRALAGESGLYDMTDVDKGGDGDGKSDGDDGDGDSNGDGDGDDKMPDSDKTPAPPVTPLSLSNMTVRIADVCWTGGDIKSGLAVTATYGSPARTVKLTSADYALAKAGKWYRNIGKAKITVKATGMKYTGSKTVTFRIVPKKATISKSTPGKKSVKAVWKKADAGQRITGYQLQYRSKDAKKWSKEKNVSKEGRSYTIKNLAKGKRYYVRVRAYKKVGGVKYCGPWSAAKLSKGVR
jgi:hypothetical protein